MPQRITRHEPAAYRIQIQGALAGHWTDYLGGLNIEVSRQDEPPVTTLSGSVLDQGALMGVLNHLYNMGFPLLTVECQDAIDENEVDGG